jgi:hypothetical protein
VVEAFTTRAEEEGPYLQSALICERVLQERDGTLSAIRLIDYISLSRPPADVDANTVTVVLPAQITLHLLISFKGGRRGASHEIRVIGHTPDGREEQFPVQRLVFASSVPEGAPGANAVVQLRLGFKNVGTYWFELLLDDRFVSAMPLVAGYAVVGSPTLP